MVPFGILFFAKNAQIMICDKSIELQTFTHHDIQKTFEWVLNSDLQKMFLMRGKITWEGHQRYFEELLNDSLQRIYAIQVEGQHVGNCGFKNINFTVKTGELWIYIGEPSKQRNGIGGYGTKLLIDQGFETLGFEMIYLHVADFNIAARRMYTKLNFTEVLLYETTEEWSRHGCNIIRMELKRESWM